MNWKMISLFSGLGVLMGLGSVMGWLKGMELWIWIGLMLITGVVLGHTVSHKPFLHGFLTAVIWSVVNTLIQLAFLDTYLMNNPEAAAKFEQLPSGFSPHVAFLVSLPFSAGISGVIVGALAHFSGKFLGEKKEPEPIHSDELVPPA